MGGTSPNGIPASVFIEQAVRWLGVGIDDEAEMPRSAVVAVPYAARAVSADTLGTRPAADFVLSENLSQILKKWGFGNTNGADSKKPKNADGFEIASLSTGDTTTPNAIPKYLDNIGTLGEAAMLESGGSVTIPGGNLGIGTSSPQTRLHVVGPSATYFNVGNIGIGTNNPTQTLHVVGNSLTTGSATVDGSIGIGTATPQTKLHVVGDGAKVRVAGASFTSVDLWDGGTGDPGYPTLYSFGSQVAQIGAGATYFNTGNVGIGTSNPTHILHVVGDSLITGSVTVNGNLAAKYQDVAEWVDTPETLEPGTVVIVDPNRDNNVIPAVKPYDTRVAGAVSGQPGLVLGEPTANGSLIAQSGRVRIKADAGYGAIRKGDLLVSSATPGHVMRSQPIRLGGRLIHRPGKLVGKALEALPNGKGEILVLLTLQ